jgi:hypothetical protein
VSRTPISAGAPRHITDPPGFNGCDFGATRIVSTVVITTDGGVTWQLRPLPTDVPLPQLDLLSCATATVCWLGGQEAVPATIGNVQNGGSPVLLGTTDRGSTWKQITFVVPPGAPNYDSQSFLSMGPISRPSPDACVALGSAAQGHRAPPSIASSHIPGHRCRTTQPGSTVGRPAVGLDGAWTNP